MMDFGNFLKKANRKEVSLFYGGMIFGRNINPFKEVNKLIIDRFSESGLSKIKELAWDIGRKEGGLRR